MIKYLLFFIFLSCGIIGCTVQKSTVFVQGDVSRVFMHEPGLYSILTPEFKSISFRRGINYGRTKIEIIADVPIDKNMWYEGEYIVDCGIQHWKYVKIHIHKATDINGGGFEKRIGKFSHIFIQTIVIASNKNRNYWC